MAIASTDILYYLSAPGATAGNATAGTVNGSLGKYISTTAVSASSTNNIFDDITGAENAASTVDYRCVFILNNHASLTLQNAVVYVSSEVAGGASVAIATDNVAVSAKGSATAQATSIATETTAPTAVSAFSTPTNAGTGLVIGNIPAGSVKAVWIRRTAANSSATNADGFVLSVAGDTAA